MLCTFAEIYTMHIHMHIYNAQSAMLELCIYLVYDLQIYARVSIPPQWMVLEAQNATFSRGKRIGQGGLLPYFHIIFSQAFPRLEKPS